SAGHVVIVAGSDEAPGAAVLAGVAALRAGAGKVTVWTRARALNAPPDLLVRPFREETPAAVEECVAFVRDHADSVVIGPGLGLDAFAATLCHQVARQMKMPVVLDADALTHAAADPSIFKASPGPRVVTPHPKEAARLLSCDVRDIQADRYRAVLRIAREFQVVSCLKGSHTVLAEPEGEIRVVRRGSPALAVAGTGDVLAGAVGAHVVALPAMDGASVAVLQHAVAGELASVGDRGLLASEVAAALPAALASFCSDDVVLDDV
ncbi:MAG: NAD(P)H-hydrate dehydratase, partial [Myxococcales bacterium]|nr:NAD(P)H-hydrate dehydratase [Myxococcales bacterium]